MKECNENITRLKALHYYENRYEGILLTLCVIIIYRNLSNRFINFVKFAFFTCIY